MNQVDAPHLYASQRVVVVHPEHVTPFRLAGHAPHEVRLCGADADDEDLDVLLLGHGGLTQRLVPSLGVTVCEEHDLLLGVRPAAVLRGEHMGVDEPEGVNNKRVFRTYTLNYS